MKTNWMAALVAAALAAGCSTADEARLATGSADGAGAGAGSAAAGSGTGGVADIDSREYFAAVIGDRVFFATDSFSLDAEAQQVLTRQAAWLNRNPGTQVTIEGHADERGTREYNLALGARRANAARSFLIAQGVPASRLRSVSFGKERPVSLCSEERCWSQNRRAVTVVAGAPAS